MDDLLDGEAAEFEWGPDRPRGRCAKAVASFRQRWSERTQGASPAVTMVLVAIGSAALAIGAVSTWDAYRQPAAAVLPIATPTPVPPPPTPTPEPTARPQPTPSPTATPIPMVIVHVSGQVGAPGIVEVSILSRAYEAVEAAGGALDDADLDRVNLASPVVDGSQVHIPAIGDDKPTPVPQPTPFVPPTPPPTPTPIPASPTPIPNLDPHQ